MDRELARHCDRDLLNLLYYVLLGRDPESNSAWLGAPLDEVARGILASEEFRVIADACLDLDFTYRQEQRSRRDRGLAAEKLVQNGAPMPRTYLWHDLLLSGLEWLSGILPGEMLPEVVGPVILVLKTEFLDVVDIGELIDRKFDFNAAWFLNANKGVPGLDRVAPADLEEFAAQAVLIGEAEISPFFSVVGDKREGLRRKVFGNSYKGESRSLDVLLEQVVVAAKNGLIDHWLFDEFTYIQERKKAFSLRTCKPWEPIASPYLDFLINGDRNKIRPHPLFCPVAYNSLNAHSREEADLFAHYLQIGQFLGYRTSALFDPDYYNALNPTALLDVLNGRFASALESYCKEGLSKGLPFSPDFDANYYSRTYEDVARGLEEGKLNASWHFLREGISEGRRASPYFDPRYYSQRYPFVDKICRDSSISGLEHFLLFGRFDGMRPSEPLLERELDILQAKGLYERRALDSLIRLSRRPLDFTPFVGENPLVSIIVPVHNQISFTARFLELAYFASSELKRRTAANCEIIVVSNGSTDKTDEFVKTFPGIKSVISAEPLGYPRAVNEGAKLADAQYMLIVNNDVEFDPGIFADLTESFGKTPDCGALGPRILSMDMTIQEAGSFIAPDGSTFGFGRGTRSSSMSGTNRDVVDYVSGCFLFLERKDFEALGGFDEAFSPGYYEEVDLCLRIAAELNKQVVLDLGISILHYEHASFMKGRPPAAGYPLILRNRQKIRRKYPRIAESSSLQKFRVPAGSPSTGGARNVRVLVIEDLIPDPRLGSGFGRTAEILRVFHDQGVAFDVMALHPIQAVDDYQFPDVSLYRNWMPGQSLEAMLQGDAGAYSHIWLCRTHNLNRLAPLLRSYKDRHDAMIICDTEAVSVPRVVGSARINGRSLSENQIRDLISAELSGSAVVDRFVAVNELDSAMIRSAGISNVSIVSHSVSGLTITETSWDERHRILLIGAVHSPLSPNFDGACWFAENVLPKIRHFEKTVTVVGYWHEEMVKRFRSLFPDPNIEFTGMVSKAELAKLYAETTLTVVPTRFAAGIPCEVIEAMLTATPVVMSKLLCDQIGLSKIERRKMAVAPVDDDGEGFASEVTRILKDRDRWKSVRAAQTAFAQPFSYASFHRSVVSVLTITGILTVDRSLYVDRNSLDDD